MVQVWKAPGKLLLAGEYSVLDGHAAVVAAVRRRVTAVLLPHPEAEALHVISVLGEAAPSHVTLDARTGRPLHGELTPLLRACLEELGEAGRSRLPRGTLLLDSSELSVGRFKLGLGSSAATAVAFLAATSSLDLETKSSQGVPAGHPSGVPAGHPSGVPAGHPSGVPAGHPSGVPAGHPSGVPAGHPSGVPAGHPSGVQRADGPLVGAGEARLSQGSVLDSFGGSPEAPGMAPPARGLRPLDPQEFLSRADRAHRAAQGGTGSGIDVAAAVYGGLFAFRRKAGRLDVAPLDVGATGCSGIACWTGQSASTPRLVQAVRRSGASLAELARPASLLIEALEAGSAPLLIEAIAAGHAAMEDLAERSGAPLVLEQHRVVARLAARHGGAAKPTGAGGGDLALAVLPPGADLARFRAELEQAGTPAVGLGISNLGVAAPDQPEESCQELKL